MILSEEGQPLDLQLWSPPAHNTWSVYRQQLDALQIGAARIYMTALEPYRANVPLLGSVDRTLVIT